MGTINSSDRMAATLFPKGHCLSQEYMCVNTVHKGDSDDDYNNTIIIMSKNSEVK
jgi:hypothetical protein